jgi:hypothetical protein
VTTPITSAAPTPSCAAIDGSAVLVMEVSSVAIEIDRDTASIA